MIWYFPLEHIETRYTKHLDDSIWKHFVENKVESHAIYPAMNGREQAAPPPGCFLNAAATSEFKARQLAEFFQLSDKVKDGDILFFSDLWFPGIESIAYWAHFAKKKVRIRGLLHAGSFTDTDEVRKLERWAHQFENVVFDLAERVFVGSHFIKNDVCSKRLVDPSKITVSRFPMDSKLANYRPVKKEKIVIFNGRNHPEKQPWLFTQLAKDLQESHPDAKFIWTMNENLDKDEYYQLLNRSKVVVSFALQENFGYGILEAVQLGCIPVVPNRLVYPEFFGPQYRYDSYEQCLAKVDRLLLSETSTAPIVDCRADVESWFEG